MVRIHLWNYQSKSFIRYYILSSFQRKRKSPRTPHPVYIQFIVTLQLLMASSRGQLHESS
jgi:hypothetical protein